MLTGAVGAKISNMVNQESRSKGRGFQGRTTPKYPNFRANARVSRVLNASLHLQLKAQLSLGFFIGGEQHNSLCCVRESSRALRACPVPRRARHLFVIHEQNSLPARFLIATMTTSRRPGRLEGPRPSSARAFSPSPKPGPLNYYAS